MLAVVLTKALLTASLFWVYGFLSHLPLAVFLFVLKASAAVVYVLLQRPLSSGKRISRAMVRHVLHVGEVLYGRG